LDDTHIFLGFTITYKEYLNNRTGIGDCHSRQTVLAMSALASPARSSMKRTHDDILDEMMDLEEPCTVPADFVMGNSQSQVQRGRSEEQGIAQGDRQRDRSMTSELSDLESMREDSPVAGGVNGMFDLWGLDWVFGD